jgi:L-lactate utilization protein LutC
MSATQRDAIRYFCQQKNMTKEELADKINKTFEQPTGEELIHVLNKGAAIGRREMLDKACEWITQHIEDERYKTPDEESYRHGQPYDYFDNNMFIDDFRKAMEE